MWVTSNGTNSTEIEGSVVERVLGIYPEEKLLGRPIFRDAFGNGSIEFSDLQGESEKVLIPWQMFFLTSANLNTQINHIDNQRQHKVSAKLVAKRKGSGDVTSKRIIDRLIRQQNFLTATNGFSSNSFCGSLRGVQTNRAVDLILSHFEIDRAALWRYTSKGRALEYLINKVEAKNVNVSRGVLTNKLLPTWQVVPSDVYRSTSGFVIRDDCVPFVFLPNEINPDEVESRQIYTLIYLLAIIGLEQYDYFLGKDFRAKMLKARGMTARLHAITTELLIPASEVEPLRDQNVTPTLRDSLSTKFKVSPSALVITLRKRGIISKSEYEALKPPPYEPKKNTRQVRSPRVSTSVEKFCGQMTFSAINRAIQNGTLKSVQAQHLIWGAVNKKGYRRYRNELGI
ncbi:MAG: hypothetical protein COV79_02490 [Parcubacteria group bacterium CG11_big_fil_rev_8_21_14_0_20_41_14]|nr:MAG: hypothetical protein COV79_02490 [Parcubacteria group bacterium CG11_big_fil_rev_8_21_14_0_20_41_14]